MKKRIQYEENTQSVFLLLWTISNMVKRKEERIQYKKKIHMVDVSFSN